MYSFTVIEGSMEGREKVGEVRESRAERALKGLGEVLTISGYFGGLWWLHRDTRTYK